MELTSEVTEAVNRDLQDGIIHGICWEFPEGEEKSEKEGDSPAATMLSLQPQASPRSTTSRTQEQSPLPPLVLARVTLAA
jgi:hypothetical protein